MKLSVTSRRMISVICIAAIVFIIAGVIVSLALDTIEDDQAIWFALGVLLTSGLSVVKVILLERAISKTLDMDNPTAGSNYIRIQYLMRYLMTGGALALAGIVTRFVQPPFLNLYGAIAGAFTLQISVIVVRSMKLED